MKLAEALITRADIQNRINALEGRLNANAVVQEGEECAEDPRELIKQLNEMSGELEKLVARINLTNAAVTRDGETLTAMLARRDCLKQRVAIMRDFLNCASNVGQRSRGSEIRLRPSVPVRGPASESGPNPGSTACSGCGMRPTTLPRPLRTPAMSCAEPLGLPPT